MANPNWVKGVSGNPSGRPKIIKTMQELARQHCPEAIATLVKVLKNGPPAARVAAANAILDRGYGKPPQFNTSDNAQFRRAVEMSDDELATIASHAGRGGNGTAPPPRHTDEPH